MTALKYKEKDLRLDPQLEKDTTDILKVLANRERDVFKVNTRSFRRFDMVKEHGLHMPQPRINAVFERLAEVGACSFKKGKSGMYEKAVFAEPARIVARRMLGVPDEPTPRRIIDSEVTRMQDLAVAVLHNASMPDSSKVEMLKLLFKKG